MSGVWRVSDEVSDLDVIRSIASGCAHPRRAYEAMRVLN